MSLSKKHFERIAAGLSYTMPPDRCRGRKAQWSADVVEMADVCSSLSNGNFNRQRFLEACHDRAYWKGRV